VGFEGAGGHRWQYSGDVLWVGTSGWQYRHWIGVLYPAGTPSRQWLALYSANFQTVEVNSTFYRLPSGAAFAGWAASTPDDFRLSCKLSRYLTHVLRLRRPGPALERFLGRASALGPKMGPLLLQLPPDLEVAEGRLEETLAALPEGIRVAVEPRHPSWFRADVRACLERHRAALCLSDREGSPVCPLWRTATFGYLRLHWGGRPGPGYDRGQLVAWLERLGDLHGREDDVFVYFNNDPQGAAVEDARQFSLLASSRGWRVSRTAAHGLE
jgi:uncharacterized protein YecE (DUF72 family)